MIHYIVAEEAAKLATNKEREDYIFANIKDVDDCEDTLEYLNQMMERKKLFSENWVQEADVDTGSVPAGTFTKNADEIVKTLLEVTGNDVTKAVRKITFYINRFGKDLPNKGQVIKAKDTLVNME